MDFIEWSATIEMISNLQSKWDAASHHPELLHASHHVHLPDGQVQGVNPTPDITTILDEIQANLKMESGTNA